MASKGFNNLLRETGIVDNSYDARGFLVWLPYGVKIRRRIEDLMRKGIEDKGYDEIILPSVIPKSYLRAGGLEKEFQDNFSFSVEGEDFILSPASDAGINYFMGRQDLSYIDLPKKLWRLGSIFRRQLSTKTLVFDNEISMFLELYAYSRDKGEGKDCMDELIDYYQRLSENLLIPHVISSRTRHRTAGNQESSIPEEVVHFDSLFEGKVLSYSTIYSPSTSFTEKYGVSFRDTENNLTTPHLTMAGSTERVFTLAISETDKKGLIIPTSISPFQLVLVPIFNEEGKERVVKSCRELKKRLEGDYRVHLDERKMSVGKKRYEWEKKGVPIRLEIGTRELDQETVSLCRRDGVKKAVALENLPLIKDELKTFDEYLREKREGAFSNSIFWLPDCCSSDNLANLTQEIKAKGLRDKIFETPLCPECVQESYDNLKLLGKAIEEDVQQGDRCLCGEEASQIYRLAFDYHGSKKRKK